MPDICAVALEHRRVHQKSAREAAGDAWQKFEFIFAITMEIYTVISSAATRDALKRLGEAIDR